MFLKRSFDAGGILSLMQQRVDSNQKGVVGVKGKGRVGRNLQRSARRPHEVTPSIFVVQNDGNWDRGTSGTHSQKKLTYITAMFFPKKSKCPKGISFSRVLFSGQSFCFFVAFWHGCLDSSDLKNTEMTQFYTSSSPKMQSKNSPLSTQPPLVGLASVESTHCPVASACPVVETS